MNTLLAFSLLTLLLIPFASSGTEDTEAARWRQSGMIWWTLWVLYAIAWTVALLCTFPIAIRDSVVPEEYGFSTGKALHVAAYAFFAILTSLLPTRRRTMLLVVILHAPTTELLQLFTGRTGSPIDVGLDWIGVALGIGMTWRRWHARNDQTRPNPQRGDHS